jgi:hypothetical protein
MPYTALSSFRKCGVALSSNLVVFSTVITLANADEAVEVGYVPYV